MRLRRTGASQRCSLHGVAQPRVLDCTIHRRGEMASEVRFSLPKAEVLHADLEFNVRRNGTAFGKLLVSKGAVVWRSKGKYWRGKKFSWLDFDKFMDKYGRPEHRRPSGSRPRPKKLRLKLKRKVDRALPIEL